MNTPLLLRFKLIALAPQIYVTDASGATVLYVRQKLFKLKEAVSVFGDQGQTELKYTIKADRILDFSARYTFRDPAGGVVGAVKRRGLRSMWRARFDIYDGDSVAFTIQESSALVRLGDSFFQQIPIVGAFAGYVFNPSYDVARPDGAIVMRLVKLPAFWEGKLRIDRVGEVTPAEQERIVLGLLMMVLLERTRG
jgi:uncharacterized protein YxjI